jgi:pantoate--beta-alanine ligase
MQSYSNSIRQEGKNIGLVPTMGYLHEGHLSLIRILRSQCDILVVSIFINPTQFGPNEDLKKYPRDFEWDETLCQEEKVDVIFYPEVKDIYPIDYLTYVNVEKVSDVLCGSSRPGHFKGVATIVAKLFNIVNPHLAVFGQKDYQQVQIIKQMTKDLNFDIKILTAPIVREEDGLALSSRNKYLSSEERKSANVIYRSLQHAKDLVTSGIDCVEKIKEEMRKMILDQPYTRIDYVAIVDPGDLSPIDQIQKKILIALAVFVGSTRLIDNILIEL